MRSIGDLNGWALVSSWALVWGCAWVWDWRWDYWYYINQTSDTEIFAKRLA